MKQSNASKTLMPSCEIDSLAKPTQASNLGMRVDANNGSLVIDSVDLFAGHKMLTIEHNGSSYLLRITRENKLILTK